MTRFYTQDEVRFFRSRLHRSLRSDYKSGGDELKLRASTDGCVAQPAAQSRGRTRGVRDTGMQYNHRIDSVLIF